MKGKCHRFAPLCLAICSTILTSIRATCYNNLMCRHTTICRAGNEPSYSGSARKKLGSGSARELNKPSLSLNLGLINLGLGSGSARARLEKARLGPPGPIRRWNEAFVYGLRLAGSGLHRCDPDSGASE